METELCPTCGKKKNEGVHFVFAVPDGFCVCDVAPIPDRSQFPCDMPKEELIYRCIHCALKKETSQQILTSTGAADEEGECDICGEMTTRVSL